MKKKVLIIEDFADVGDSLRMLIELEGYGASVARTGLEGREKARSDPPDLILMDLSLPDWSGLDLTRELRSLPETAETPILCVSSYTEGIEEKIIEAGCNEIFSKTTFMTTYGQTLKKYLDT